MPVEIMKLLCKKLLIGAYTSYNHNVSNIGNVTYNVQAS